MKRFLAGFLAGVILTLSGSLGAQQFSSFSNATEFMQNRGDFDRWYRLGYVSGLADTYGFIVEYFTARSDTSYEKDFEDIAKIYNCLKSRGTSLGTLTSFSEDIVRGAYREPYGNLKKESTAAIISAACAVVY